VKNVIKVLMIAVVLSGLIQAEEMKRYKIKSAKIEYDIKGSADVMGMVKSEEVGKKRLIFDNYGIKELEEVSKVIKQMTMGKTDVNKMHILHFINGAIVYEVNFEQKAIMRQKNSSLALNNLFGGENLSGIGENMLKKIGGKKLGTDKVAGYSCDIWDLSGIKQCLYQGIPLRVESDIMGIKSLEIATKAEFNLKLTKDDFNLPDYPIYNFDMDVMMEGVKPKPLERSKLEKMDRKVNQKVKEEAKESKDALKGLGAGIEAAKKAGYDPKSGKDMTLEQERAMKKVMMNAMGGEDAIFQKIKAKSLKGLKNVPKAKKCFEDAKSVDDANVCEQIIDSEDPMVHYRWNSQKKIELLKEIDGAKVMLKCVESAKNMDELQVCFPKDKD
jgi:hypothetical protein